MVLPLHLNQQLRIWKHYTAENQNPLHARIAEAQKPNLPVHSAAQPAKPSITAIIAGSRLKSLSAIEVFHYSYTYLNAAPGMPAFSFLQEVTRLSP